MYPESCQGDCRCFSSREERALVADCSHSGLTGIPSSLPEALDWLILSHNSISYMNQDLGNLKFLTEISKLNLS